MLPIKKISYLLIFLAVVLFWSGCLPKKQTETAVKSEKIEPAETENPMDKIATLELSTEKSEYKSNEPIPLELKINIGKFDLPVEKASVEGEGTFFGLIVKDAEGKRVNRQKAISLNRNIVKNYQDDKLKRCVEGITLLKNQTISASINDLRKFYSLEPGKYSLQVTMSLRVYNDNFLDEKLPAIAELEQEIVALKSDTKLSEAAKNDAIESIKQDIATLESKMEKTDSGRRFLPLDSLRGRAELKSNLIEINISSAAMTEEEIEEIEEKIQEAESLIELKLSSKRLTYSADEPIPIELTIQAEKEAVLDKSAVTGRNAFSGIVVKALDGKVLEPKRTIGTGKNFKELHRDGKIVECIPGVKLSPGEQITVSIDDLSEFYDLEPGKYSLQLVTRLKFFKDEFLTEKPKAVIEYEKEIAAIKRDTKLPEAAKKDAIANLEKEIEFQMKEFKEEGQERFLALDSVEKEIKVRTNEIQIDIIPSQPKD